MSDSMQVIGDLNQYQPAGKPLLVAVGIFDGVHRGHQAILGSIVARAGEKRCIPAVLSFHPHPQKVIASGRTPPLLQTFLQKAELMQDLGIRVFFRLPFSRRISLYSPREFVEKILSSVGAAEVHVGGNFRFGHRRSGDIETLKQLGKEYGFEVFRTDPVHFRGIRISSTRIRNMLSCGRVALAGRLLGRPYEIRGSVIQGAEKGATLGFPTANLKSENELIPSKGVYVTEAEVNQSKWIGATNIGYRPTLHGFTATEPTIETHLLGFSGNLYGKPMKLRFCFRLRDEKKFENLEALVAQIHQDIRSIKRYKMKLESLTGGMFK